MRLLKLALLLEIELGIVWTLLLIGAPDGDVGLASLLLFVPVYAGHLPAMIAGAVMAWKRPDTRVLATVVMIAPLSFIVAPAVVRGLEGGRVPVHPAAWYVLGAIPLGACIFLPRHAAGFIPAWALRSRGLNVATVGLLGTLVACWTALIGLSLAGVFQSGTGEAVLVPTGTDAPNDLAWLVAIFVSTGVMTLVGFLTLLASWVGLFQDVDRRNQGLRVAQLVLSLLLLVPSVAVFATGLFLAAVALVNPG